MTSHRCSMIYLADLRCTSEKIIQDDDDSDLLPKACRADTVSTRRQSHRSKFIEHIPDGRG